MDTSGPRVIIGRRERVDLPEWGLERVRAKIDTGACSSALDVVEYELVEVEGSGLVARLSWRRTPTSARVYQIEAPVVRTVGVTNPGGRHEVRPVVETVMRLGRWSRRIRLTLTNRTDMRYRLILGRQALAGLFLVDVSRKYLHPLPDSES